MASGKRTDRASYLSPAALRRQVALILAGDNAAALAAREANTTTQSSSGSEPTR
jgi:hypothetical protein